MTHGWNKLNNQHEGETGSMGRNTGEENTGHGDTSLTLTPPPPGRRIPRRTTSNGEGRVGTLEASRVAMADQGTRVAMTGQGTRVAMAEQGAQEAMAEQSVAVAVAVASALAPASTTGALYPPPPPKKIFGGNYGLRGPPWGLRPSRAELRDWSPPWA